MQNQGIKIKKQAWMLTFIKNDIYKIINPLQWIYYFSHILLFEPTLQLVLLYLFGVTFIPFPVFGVFS